MKSEIFRKTVLYIILDRALIAEGDIVEAARQAAAGGADLIQYRDKQSSERLFLDTAQKIRRILTEHHIPLIINDRLNIALSVGAEGVHLGPDDLPVARARELGGSALIIGASARSVSRALQVQKEGADYIGAGSFYPTSTKSDAHLIKEELFRKIVESIQIPVIAVGGLNENNLTRPLSAGAGGIAVASAIFKYPGIEESVRRLKTKIKCNYSGC